MTREERAVDEPGGRTWIDYRTVWRWHFYAGLFCIPFVLWLAATGSIYLFRPQIEAWIDRPYDRLALTGPRTTPEAHVEAALAAVPGGRLNSYELPLADDSSVRVLVGKGAELYRVYVHPQSAAVLQVVREDQRLMRRIFYLHGELMMGARGSMLVETAASWAIVLILTGLFLWWPRKAGAAGTLYPRVLRGGRVFWRDMHAVTGLWVSFFTLFLLMSGLPWAKSWGTLLKGARSVGGDVVARLAWTTGRESELEARIAMNTPPDEATGDEHAAHRAAMVGSSISSSRPYASLNAMVDTVTALELAPPVLISPPSKAASTWTARSDSANRPRRTNLELDAATGAVTSRVDFGERPLIDRMVGVGVAAHEGQLFGWLNQLVGVFTALGLWTVAISALVLWWQRRPALVLGAPLPRISRVPAAVFAIVVVLGLIFPMMGITLMLVLAIERMLLVRIPAASRFLGLAAG
ncbi:MAG: PepSY domain-containing protein [Vicinamibacterales bacterium]